MVETGHKFYDSVAKKITWAHWFTLFNIVAISLISLRYIAYSGLADSTLGIIYQFISLIGHFSFLAALVFGILLFPLAFFIQNSFLYRFISLLIATIAITFLIVDTQIYRLYGFHLNPLIWQFLQKPEQVEAIYSINLHYASIPIIFVSEIVISLLMWRKFRRFDSKRIGRPVALFLFSMFALSHLIFVWADANQYRPVTHQKSLYPLSYPMTARTFLKKQGWLNEDKIQKRKLGIIGTNPEKLNYPTKKLVFSPQSTNSKTNILIINIEALRADMLNPSNMPYLQALANNGINFKNHFSGSDNSEQGVYSLLYGLPNSYWNTITENHISPVLMNTINKNNRSIGLFSSIGLVQPEFLESSFSQIKITPDTYFSKTENNNQVVQQWKKWITTQSNEKPWFSYIYLEQKNSHQFTRFGKKSIADQGKDLSLYQKQVATIDRQIKQLIDALKKQAEFKNTAIVITGTHGQAFKSGDVNSALINGSHVPMVLILPGQPFAQEITKITSHNDLVPTLMEEIFNVQNNAKTYSIGNNLLNSGTERQYVLSGDINDYIIYETDKITKFSRNGDINSIDWQGNHIKESEESTEYDITLLVDVLSTLRRFSQK